MLTDASAPVARGRPVRALSRHEIVAERRRRSAARRAARLVTRVGCTVVVLVLVVIVVGEAMGYRLLAIKSGSMTPTLAVGDVVLSHAVPPAEVRRGDIVSFRDPELNQQLVTHRVLYVLRDRATFSFTTMGDANRTAEHWRIPASGRVGKEVWAAPALGRVLTRGKPILAIALISFVASGLSGFVLRRIWGGGHRHAHRH